MQPDFDGKIETLITASRRPSVRDERLSALTGRQSTLEIYPILALRDPSA